MKLKEGENMRLTNFFLPTLREEPQDAEIDSHRLMLKAGLIRKLAAGIYSFLPLGLLSLRKVEQIIREEMNRAGAIELLFPAIMPKELWEETGRWEIYGDEMFRVKDRKGRFFCLGPTHEEAVVELARTEMRSYKELPKTYYQIQTKYRDEIRPRFGLIRAREFIMKDAYSFDSSEEGLEESYKKMFDAYVRIFKRCDLDTVAIEADSGAIGGKVSHEFVVTSCVGGESEFVYCSNCGYAANVEAARSQEIEGPNSEELANIEPVETLQAKTIEEVAAYLNVSKTRLAKSLLYKIDNEYVLAMVVGDDELNETKLKNLFSAKKLSQATDEEVLSVTGANPGAIGPVGLSVKVVVDSRLSKYRNFITGANKDGYHLKNVNLERDFTPYKVADIRVARKGDLCPRCGSALDAKSGIELGHTFKLGTKYSGSMKAYFLDADGNSKPYIMGCYGIGVGRTLQAVIEQHHDDKGIVFPVSIAPFHAIVVPLNFSDNQIRDGSVRIYEGLLSKQLEVLIDDREDCSAGEKFNDADLIGIPLHIIVGKSYKNDGKFEIKIRKTSERLKLGLEETIAFVSNFFEKELSRLR